MPVTQLLHGIRQHTRLFLRSFPQEGLDFILLWLRLDRAVPGWLYENDAHLLYSLARHGAGSGAIVEIGSAWGRSTIVMAAASKRAGREKVYAIDPHTGDPWYLQTIDQPHAFSSLEQFTINIRRFAVDDWVVPVVAPSGEAARRLPVDQIRLLYIDGLHTYEGVKDDIEGWVPRVITGGVVVFDDYYNTGPDVGVQRAVDELRASGLVEPTLHRVGELVWLRRT